MGVKLEQVQDKTNEDSWVAFRALDRNWDSGIQKNVILLKPQPNVENSLEITGIKDFFENHTNLEAAIAFFN